MGRCGSPASPRDLGAPREDAVTRVDLATGRTVATITVRRAPLDVTAMPGAVWVPNSGSGGDSVARIGPETNRAAGRPVRTVASPQSLAVGGGSLWVANHEAGTVTRIDQASGRLVADIPVPSEPHRVGAGAAWVGNWHHNSVSRIDPETNRVVGSPIPIGFRAGNLVVGTGGVWVTSDERANGAPEDVVVVRIDPQINRAVETIAVAGHPIDVAATEDAVWVSVADPGTVYGSPGATAASRPACVSLSGSHDELGGTGGPPGLGGLQARKARSPSTHPALRAEFLAAKNAAAPINQSREAHHSARPLHSPEEAIWRAIRDCRSARVSYQPAAAFAEPDPAGRTTTIRICLKRSFWLVSAVLACLSPPATDPRPS
jgi:hypothetical protein